MINQINNVSTKPLIVFFVHVYVTMEHQTSRDGLKPQIRNLEKHLYIPNDVITAI